MDFEEASTLMGLSGLSSELIYYDDMSYDGWIGHRFTFVYKSVLVTMQGCIGVSEQSFWIELIY